MSRKEPAGSAEQPLQGVVLCFTSIGPEERTRYAEMALQMGADHKLDLTSDTTHLVVGSTDTLKYQYVAREREDIKVVRPEWIEALREVWMSGHAIDLPALTQQYRVPTLSGLKICITGFDDLSFRSQLQQNVKDNGGEYTGDLTKDVTHLIAAKPEGKKYEYGIQWQKKVVSLKWYKESLERGMQLDENLYQPSIPGVEQGVGAWNRKPRPSPQLGKRTREDNLGPEPSRKLRRTASARLGSQNQDMWSDIVGGAGFDAPADARPALKPSISMPALRKSDSMVDGAANIQKDLNDVQDGATGSDTTIMSQCQFMVQCLDSKRNQLLEKVITGLGGALIGEDETQDNIDPEKLFVVLPHDIAKTEAVPGALIPDGFQVVSELWLEKCMISKSFVSPQKYTLGHVIREPRSCLKGMAVNVSGFDGLENVHIIKLVTLLGGTYVKAFTSSVSVLVCRGVFANKDKLELANHLSIPVVNEEWLWSTVRSKSKADINAHLLQPIRARAPNAAPGLENKVDTRLETQGKARQGQTKPPSRRTDQTAEADGDRAVRKESGEAARPSRTVVVHEQVDSIADGFVAQGPSDDTSLAHEKKMQSGWDDQGKRPLREVSPTSVRRNGHAAGQSKTSIPSLDGPCSMEEVKSNESAAIRTESDTRPADIAAVNGAIRELLEARSKKISESPKVDGEPKKKNRLIGRALSNLSNTSSASNARRSRASSINSINTDGLGSELPPIQSAENKSGEPVPAAGKSSFSFTGRAKTTLSRLDSAVLEMDDPELARAADHFAEQEAAPRMTQLGYEDPEEAVLLREKLAASRRKRSKKNGIEEADGDDSEPMVVKQRPAAIRKIRDDDVLVAAEAGWGAGKRTRHKQRSPQGMNEF